MSGAHDQSALSDYLAVVRRRKWIVVLAIVFVPAAAIVFSHYQKPKYQATAEVLLSRQNLASSLNNVVDPSLSVQPERLAQTQADLARVPPVIEAALAATHTTTVTAGQFASSSSVTARSDADMLEFKFTGGDRALAARLATTYAQQYIAYRKELDTQALTRARSQVHARIAELGAGGDRNPTLYATLVDREQQLATMEALQTSNATLVRAAQGASQVQPRPVRNGLLALMLGAVLGLGLAFLREGLETKVRSADEVARRLKIPLLGRIRAPPRRLARRNKLVMLEEPRSSGAEPFRVLRANLELLDLEENGTILVTSAVEGEGKSTTAANLAVALARGGRHVVLVDLDLRRPYLERFFQLGDRPGFTDVVLEATPLEAALSPVDLLGTGNARASQNGSVGPGKLEVLTTGEIPSNPGEFVGTPGVTMILETLASRAELVIIDSPPLLSVGDTLTLSSAVDALLLVTRLNLVRKPMLNELHRVLGGVPADVLGFVITEAEAEEHYGYGYGPTDDRSLSHDELEPSKATLY